MENSVPLTGNGLSYLHDEKYFHDLAAIGGRFYADVM